ncbi:MAG: glutamate racemase [Simkaniaceae bacterium]|nr:glutamate racemase [Simkaniaceae bacterium]
MADSRPIGIFDSGLGGLTVVGAVQKVLPNESIIYLGDTARVPYGNKSAVTVLDYARQITEFLLSRDAKLIVVACNTASALALESLKSEFDIPILGVIEPGVEAALHTTRNGHIGIIGTIATIASEAYQSKLRAADGGLTVSAQACPLFVPLVEEGWLDGPIVEQIVRQYLAPVNDSSADTLVLGCTHYPLLKPTIQTVVKAGTILVDSADVVATKTAELLNTLDLKANGEKGSLECFVTDLPARFESVASRFLGSPISNVEIVHL